MLTMVAALKEEITGLKAAMIIDDTVAENGYKIFHGKKASQEVLLVQTGMGRKRAEIAVRSVLERYPVSAIASFGFAGGLTPALGIGDIVLCSTLYCSSEEADPCYSGAELLSRSLQICDGMNVRQGKSVTASRPASQPEAKRALAQTFQADVVDMESYWIARIAKEKGVPFLAVRAISDTCNDSLPPVEMFGPDGEVNRRNLFFNALFHPGQIQTLVRLQRNSRIAGENLTAFLSRLVERF